MTTYERYIKKAEHNEQFCKIIEENYIGYNDWCVIAIFYAALFYMDRI